MVCLFRIQLVSDQPQSWGEIDEMPWCVLCPEGSFPGAANVHLGRREAGIFLHVVLNSSWRVCKPLMWPRALHSDWNWESQTNQLWHLSNIPASTSAPLNLLLLSGLHCPLQIFYVSCSEEVFLKLALFSAALIWRVINQVPSSWINLQKKGNCKDGWVGDLAADPWLCLVCPIHVQGTANHF